MTHYLRLLLVVMLTSCPSVARAEVAALRLYPVKGIFGLAKGQPGDRRMVSEHFIRALSNKETSYFEARFRAAFPASVKVIDATNKRRTFAVSMQVTRASYYAVPKPAIRAWDVLLPMTASVYFTNILTGEVLFATTLTHVPRGTLSEPHALPGSPMIGQLYRQSFRELVDDLVEAVHKRFNPRVITATVQQRSNDLVVLDVGRDGGIQSEDSLNDADGNEVLVLWSAPGYSVARTTLGKVQTGKTFSRISSGTLAELKRPRLLPLIEEAPEGMSQDAILQMFGDALGDAAPVSLMPVNRTFSAVLQAVAAKAQISQNEVRARALPQMFVRLRVGEPVSFEVPTDQPYRRRRVTEATAQILVQDASGRVLYATVAHSRVEDVIIEEMAMDLASRREVVVKNALVELARKCSLGFQPRNLELPVTRASGDTFEVSDPHGLLGRGRNFLVFRTVGRINREELRVPVWEAKVVDSLETTARGQSVLPVVAGAPSPRKGDLVLLQGVDTPGASRHRFGSCGRVDKLGSFALPEYEALALNQFAAAYPAPYYAPGLVEQVEALVHEGTGFEKALKLRPAAIDLCVEPVYRIDQLPQSCSGEFCAEVAKVRLTYRIRQGGAAGEVMAKRGLETTMRATALPAASSAAQRTLALHLDLIDEVLKLAPQIASSFAMQRL